MDVILLDDIDKLGYKHTIVKVKDGYGRNYLIPQKLAIIANESNQKRLNEIIKQDAAKAEKMLDEYKEMADKINEAILKIDAKASTTGKIFGSVTNVQIAQAMKAQLEMDIERRIIHIEEDIKQLGAYSAEIRFHKDVVATMKFEVFQD